MKSRSIVRFFLILACACSMLAASASAADAQSHFYTVVVAFSVDADSTVQNFHVRKVIEPLSGSNAAVNLEVPEGFVNAAKRRTEAEKFKPTLKDGKLSETMASFFYAPHESPGAPIDPISFGAMNGEMADIISFSLEGQGGQAAFFGKNLGKSAYFFMYYAIPLSKATKEERENLIHAELDRNLANVGGGTLVSNKNLSTDDQTIIEAVAKSPRNKALSVRTRFICNASLMLSLTATTPDDLSDAGKQTFDKLFESFRFR